jgi:hypothetical protein
METPPPRPSLDHLPIRTGTLQTRLDSIKGVSVEESRRTAREAALRTGVLTGDQFVRPEWARYKGSTPTPS